MSLPAVESRGGERPDWAKTRPGRELPQRGAEVPDDECEDAAPLPVPCPGRVPGCGGD